MISLCSATDVHVTFQTPKRSLHAGVIFEDTHTTELISTSEVVCAKMLRVEEMEVKGKGKKPMQEHILMKGHSLF